VLVQICIQIGHSPSYAKQHIYAMLSRMIGEDLRGPERLSL
jgi:hypothetical protein